MRNVYMTIPLCIIFYIIANELNAQDIKDEMKRRFRQEIIELNNKPEHIPIIQRHTSKLFSNQNDKVIKVSPYTKLPTKGDRIILLHHPEDNEIHINLTVTNAPPINERPAGSISFQSMGGKMQIISTSGKSITPSGIGAPIRKRHKKSSNILKMLGD